MAKLRKMLGRADDPQIVTLMGLIETQSPSTLAAWAADWVQKRYLPVYRARFPEDTRLEELLDAVRATLAGRLTRAQLRAALRQARTVPLEAEGEPAAQAAAGRGDRLLRPADPHQRPGLCLLWRGRRCLQRRRHISRSGGV